MFVYDKKLQYPVKIDKPNPRLAAIIISQYGGPDGELGASLRYLSQRYSMPFDELKGLLTDIGTEELGHLEMIGALVHQLTRWPCRHTPRTTGTGSVRRTRAGSVCIVRIFFVIESASSSSSTTCRGKGWKLPQASPRCAAPRPLRSCDVVAYRIVVLAPQPLSTRVRR